MKGVVVIPNLATPYAVIERSDGLCMVVEPLNRGWLSLMDVVEMGDIQTEPRVRLKNLTTEARIEVSVVKVGFDLSWEEKKALVEKISR